MKEEPSGEEEGGKPSESEEVAPEEAPEAPEAILSLEGPGNLMSNLLNDGTAAYYDGYVYHSDKMMFGNLMKTEVATDETQLLVRGSLHDINVSGDRVFAVGYTEPKDPKDLSQYGIFMASLDGSDVRLLKEGYFEELVLYDEYLYFYDTMDGDFLRMKYDGTEETLLLEGAYPQIVILEDTLYVHGSLDMEDLSSYIFTMPLSGGEPEKLDPSGTFGGTIHVADGDLFYISRDNDFGGMKRYDTETGEIERFLDTWISDIAEDEEWMYYYWNGVRMDNADQGIYKSRFDGSEAVMLKAMEGASSFNVAGGKLYYTTNDEKRRVTRMDLTTLEESFVPLADELGN